MRWRQRDWPTASRHRNDGRRRASLAVIRSLARRPRPLSAAEVRRRHGNLVAAARRRFGSWSKAVVAAGVDPVKLRRAPPWTPERIVEAILKRALCGQPLG